MNFTAAEQRTLLEVARTAIAAGLEPAAPVYGPRRPSTGKPPVIDPTHFGVALRAHRASFVTLELEGTLRGCIGELEASDALIVGVARNAFAAAFHDPRFAPLRRAEFGALDIHISVLSDPVPIAFECETELLAGLRVGVDGLTIARGARKATFLPSVWQTLGTPALFLAHLKQKAGIAAEVQNYQAWRYTAASLPSPGERTPARVARAGPGASGDVPSQRS